MTEIEIEPELRDYANQRHDEIQERSAGELERLKKEAVPALLASRMPQGKKYFRLALLADRAAEIVAPSTPCSKGCSDCCYQAVPIPLFQAEILAQTSGRAIERGAGISLKTVAGMALAVARANANAEAQLHDPTPCPFLVDNACSVYEVRPVNCRTHHVLHSDSSRCSLFHGLKLPQVKYDLRVFDEAMALLGGQDSWADIREWFPA